MTDGKAITDRASFIRTNTKLLTPPLVPEVTLHLAEESLPIWQKTEEQLGEEGLPPPFWAFAWAGGQALARFVLDHPELVKGKRVIDLAAGSGLVAIAAMKAGAASVLAAEIDAFAVEAIRINAAENAVAVEAAERDLLAEGVPAAGIILVGDLFYEKPLAERALAWLRRCRDAGLDVLIGDPGRSYLPREALTEIGAYQVPVTRELEDAEIKRTAVWRLKS
ncbi:MAG: 50S ribosomal protein L11 methyltransferase [Hyphomicrobiaceae bacterium]